MNDDKNTSSVDMGLFCTNSKNVVLFIYYFLEWNSTLFISKNTSYFNITSLFYKAPIYFECIGMLIQQL